MAKVYVLLTKSNTILSKTISTLTNANYTHASLSFNKQLTNMCSFGRKYPRLPFPGAIRHESLTHGFYQLYNNIPCIVLEIEVTTLQYRGLVASSNKMLQNAKDYKYSVLGLILCGLNIQRTRHNKYFCSQFVADLLYKYNVIELDKDPSLVKPIDFLNMPECSIIYSGMLNNYTPNIIGDNKYA